MAMTDNGSLMVRYRAVSSVVPDQQTFSRPSFRISFEKDMDPGIFKLRFHMILCYNKASSEDSGWNVAGWTKKSMGIALSDQPMLAGRMKRLEDGGLEIVSNDAGVRLVEAQIAMNLEEFVSFENKEDVQRQLVSWEGIDEKNPQFCPLMYVQVTNFKCGAYTIGISCSLLLADPLSTTNFLKNWTNIYAKTVNANEPNKTPLCYFPKYGNPRSTPLYRPAPATLEETSGQTLIFKCPETTTTMNDEMKGTFAVSCIQRASAMIGNNATSKLYLISSAPSNGSAKIDTISVKQTFPLESSKNCNGIHNINTSWGGYIDADKICIAGENKPIHYMYWICSPADEGVAMIISSGLDMKVIVTIPNENDMIEIV